jgi:hypothetical protein
MSRDPLAPVLLGEVRALGFPISLSCPICNHSARIAVDALAGLTELHGSGARLAQPAHPEQVRQGYF